MDPRLLKYYNGELQHLREMGAEFALQFPKIAARLGIDGIEVIDPYVERLIEGAAFLSARIQIRLDSEFPRFTQRLLDIVYPDYLAPTPAMLVARFQPDLADANLAKGVVLPRGTAMRAQLGKGDATACEFRTAHALRLLPIEVTQVQYFSYAPDLPLSGLPDARKIRGGLRIRLKAGAGLKFNQIEMDRLPLYFSGSDELAYRLHELSLGACLGVLGVPTQRPATWHQFLPASSVQPLGYADSEALLPVTLKGFQGYRLLREYFSFPQRFLFAELAGLGEITRRCADEELDLVLLFSRADASLEPLVDASHVSLFCAPAINLFPRRTDRIHITRGVHDYHVVVDRSRPMDFEVHALQKVTGFGEGNVTEREFLPFYAAYQGARSEHSAYYSMQREPRLLSATQQRRGARSSYIGSEVFLSLVDGNEAPYPEDLKQLSVSALCTNRDLPLHMPSGVGKTDFTLEAAAPVVAVRIVRGPSRPQSGLREGGEPWRFINHLSLNYLTLLDKDSASGAAALRELLGLYANPSDAALNKQVEGLRSIKLGRLVRRLPMPGPITFGRGINIEMEVDEMAYQGASVFLFGCVMEQFFARYVSINSFTETVLRGSARGEMMRWVPRCGERAIL